MYYRRTLDILQCAELQLIGRPSPWPTNGGYRRVADTVFGSPWLVVAGGQILLRKIPWIILVAMVCFLPMLLFSEGRWTELIIPSLVFASGAVYFGMSSLSLAAMVKEADLKCVRDSMLSSCNDSEELALLEAGLAVARAAAMERLSRQGVIVGVLWECCSGSSQLMFCRQACLPRMWGGESRCLSLVGWSSCFMWPSVPVTQ